MIFKLKKPLKNTDGSLRKEITVKDEKDISAGDIAEALVVPNYRNITEGIANISALTTSQVNSLHPTDWNKLSLKVGKFIISLDDIEKD